VASEEEIGDLLGAEDWDVVINTIAVTSHEKCEANPNEANRVNAELPAFWAKICADTGKKFIHISTDAVFDGQSAVPYEVDHPTNALRAYGRSKSAGEAAVATANPGALIIRTNFFGWSPTGQTGVLDFFYRSLRDSFSITGFVDYTVSSIYSYHFVRAIVALVELNAQGIHHVVSSDSMSKLDFGIAVARQFGFNSDLIRPGSVDEAHGLAPRGHDLALSTQTTESLLGYTLPTTMEGIELASRELERARDFFRNRL
jgi:dTDP-4-dehydrorhamnose reductase